MTPNLSSQEPLVLQPAQKDISVSVVMPFEPRTQSRKAVETAFKKLTDEVESRLLQQVSRQSARLICAQLQQLFAQLDYSAAARSVVFWVRADQGRMVYWQMPMVPAVVVGPSFDVRQLLEHRKEEQQYLLLAMGDHFGGIYLGNGKQLSRLVANAPVSAGSGQGIDPSMDPAQQKSITLERSVRHFDNALTILLRAYQLPVFIVAPRAQLGLFRQLWSKSQKAAAFVEVPASINDYGLQQAMAPHLANWQGLKEQRLQKQLEEALQAGKLAVGISEVWTAANERRGRLLIVEADYQYPAYMDAKSGVLYTDAIPMSQLSRHAGDAVADAMERILAAGGKVEIVGKGTLAEYVHVAMICY